MATSFIAKNCKITLNKAGSRLYEKVSYPVHHGIFTEIESDNFIFHFNLNAELIRAKGKGTSWAHPHEWLKRTCGNDWIYYSTGGYTGVFEATGEYYLPNLQYPTNNLMGGHPFEQREVKQIVDNWYPMLKELSHNTGLLPNNYFSFFSAALNNTPGRLAILAENFFSVIEGRVSVLPPDSRHTDYNIIPLTISKGCLYKCRFCKVKNKIPFRAKSRKEIDVQIARLKNLFDQDLLNYNAVFLGEHDALQVSPDLLCYSIEKSYKIFGFNDSYINHNQVFMFGSVTSILQAPDQLFANLEKLPGTKYINVGLESADQETLDYLGKPISSFEVQEAFKKIQVINNKYNNIEITVNFIMDENLPQNHYSSMLQLIQHSQSKTKPKGTVYLSPLKFDAPARKHLFEFNRFKVLSRYPTFLYIIQRL